MALLIFNHVASCLKTCLFMFKSVQIRKKDLVQLIRMSEVNVCLIWYYLLNCTHPITWSQISWRHRQVLLQPFPYHGYRHLSVQMNPWYPAAHLSLEGELKTKAKFDALWTTTLATTKTTTWTTTKANKT